MNMITILIISANLNAPDHLQLQVFWKKMYDVTVFVYEVTKWLELHCRSGHVIKISRILEFSRDKLS